MTEISIKNLHKYFGTEHLLRGVDFEVNTGDRVALLGNNGSGKTTIIKIINKEIPYDEGTVSVAGGRIIGILDQMPNYPADMTVYQVLKSIFSEVDELEQQLKTLENLMATGDEVAVKKYGEVLSSFEALGGYTLDSTIAKVCNGLNISEQMQNMLFSSLSGGEKTRINLARIILLKPDILLLDEPTNHLDIESLEWFENYLNEYQGTIVIISHDRYFLDRVVDRVVEIENGVASSYEGNYTEFQLQKEQRQEQLLNQVKNETKRIKQLESAARRMRDWAQYSKNPGLHKKAAAMETRLAKMKESAIEFHRSNWQIKSSFKTDERSSNELFEIVNVTKKYDERVLFSDLNFSVRKGDRLAIVGANDTGKTTLINLLLGQNSPDEGYVKKGAYVRYSLLEQHVKFECDENSVLTEMMNSLIIDENKARSILGKFYFRGDDVFKTVGNLSGGEKSRLRLAILMQGGINLLILDEPTNHLDINSREWLEESLEDFSGSLIFVSHDRYFISRFANRFLNLAVEETYTFEGNYEEYLNYRERLKTVEHLNSISSVKRKEQAPAKKVDKPKGFNPKNIEKKITKLEKEIEGLQARLDEVTDEMEANSADFLFLQKLVKESDELENQILEKMMEVEGYTEELNQYN